MTKVWILVAGHELYVYDSKLKAQTALYEDMKDFLGEDCPFDGTIDDKIKWAYSMGADDNVDYRILEKELR